MQKLYHTKNPNELAEITETQINATTMSFFVARDPMNNATDINT